MKIDRLFVVSLGAITGLASCSSGQDEEAQRPNILILLADDAGYADFGFMGATDIQTPNIDRLAAEGCIFTDAHVAATVSSPSRSMMLTGRYGQRYGYECNLDKPGDGLPDDEELLPALLKRYDYRTGCIGKWHLGSEPSQRPNAKGFDTFYGLLAGHRSYFYDPETSDKDGNLQQYQYNGRKLSFDGYFTDELASKAQQFVTESEQPSPEVCGYDVCAGSWCRQDCGRTESGGQVRRYDYILFERQWRFHDQPVLQPSVERLQGK